MDNKREKANVIDILAEKMHATAQEKGWWDEERNDGECIALMHSELSEALEKLRKGDECSDEELAEELADCIIRILDYSCARGLNVGQALIEKMEENEDRPHKHGGKAF